MSREMTRIQFYVDSDLKKRLEILAAHRQISKSELIRQSIRSFLQEGKFNEEEPLLGIIGLGRSGMNDISERHDIYLAQEKLERKME